MSFRNQSARTPLADIRAKLAEHENRLRPSTLPGMHKKITPSVPSSVNAAIYYSESENHEPNRNFFIERINSTDSSDLQTSRIDATILWTEDDDFSALNNSGLNPSRKLMMEEYFTFEHNQDLDVKDNPAEQRGAKEIVNGVAPSITDSKNRRSICIVSPVTESINSPNLTDAKKNTNSCEAAKNNSLLAPTSESKLSPVPPREMKQSHTTASISKLLYSASDNKNTSFVAQTPPHRPIAEVEHSRRKHAARAYEFGIRCQASEGRVNKLLEELEEVRVFSETERRFRSEFQDEIFLENRRVNEMEVLLKQSEEKIKFLCSDLNKANSQITSLKDDNASLSATVEMCEMATVSHEEDKHKIKRLEEDLQIALQQSVFVQEKTEITALENILKKSTNRANEGDFMIKKISSNAETAMKEVVDRYETRIKKLESEIVKTKNQMEQKVTDQNNYWQAQLEETEAEFEWTLNAMKEDKENIIENGKEALQLRIKELEGKIKETEVSASIHQRSVTGYEARISYMRQKIDDFEQDKENKANRVELHVEKLRFKLEETEKMHKREKALRKEFELSKQHSILSESLKKSRATSEGLLETRNKTIASLQRSLAEVNGELAAWRQKVQSQEEEQKLSSKMSAQALECSKEKLEGEIKLLRKEFETSAIKSEILKQDLEGQITAFKARAIKQDEIIEVYKTDQVSLKEDVRFLEEKRCSLKSDISTLNQNLEEHTANDRLFAEMEKEFLDLKKSFENLKNTISDRDKKILEITNSLQESNKIIESSAFEISSLKSDNKQLLDKYNTCNESVDELKRFKKEQDATISGLNCTYENVRCEVEEKKVLVQKFELALQKSQSGIEFLEKKVKKLLSDCETKDLLLLKCNQRIQFLLNVSKSAEEHQSELKKQLSSAKKTVATLKECRESFLSEKSNLTEDYEQLSTQLKNMLSQKEKLQAENRLCQKNLRKCESMDNEIMRVKKQFEEQERKYRALENEKNEIEKELTETNELATSAADRLDILQQQIDEKNIALQDARHAAESAISDLEDVAVNEDKLWEMQNNVRDAHNQIVELREELKTSISEIEDLKEQVRHFQDFEAESNEKHSSEIRGSSISQVTETVFGYRDEGESRESIERAAMKRFLEKSLY